MTFLGKAFKYNRIMNIIITVWNCNLAVVSPPTPLSLHQKNHSCTRARVLTKATPSPSCILLSCYQRIWLANSIAMATSSVFPTACVSKKDSGDIRTDTKRRTAQTGWMGPQLSFGRCARNRVSRRPAYVPPNSLLQGDMDVLQIALQNMKH
jgi:hypothetical protein